jgi:hypothetical protein
MDPSAPRPKPTTVPKPVASSSNPSGVSYLSDEEKAKLFSKYGKIKAPTPSDVLEVAQSGANCKLQ